MRPHRALAAFSILLAVAATTALDARQRSAAPAPKPPVAQSAPARPAPPRTAPVAVTPARPTPAPEPAAPADQPETAPAQVAVSKPADASAGFTYNPEGRRDPFISLIGKGSDPKGQGSRPPGIPGLLINEVSVKGIVHNNSGYVALIQGADNKTYVVKAGDRLLDGSVKSILQDAVVFSQDVSDPLSLVKQKEIRKPLRTAEGGRG
jgi:type IV pilus assembly protein PilP